MTNTNANILNGLNDQQREAVKKIFGPLLVFAGAGSGKTKVITHRIAYLIANGVKPENILAVTFTNKAAAEMRTRIARMINKQEARKITISTFHSFAVKILRQWIYFLGYKRTFCIYTEQDKRSLVKKTINHYFSQLPSGFYKTCEYQISHWKNQLLLPENIDDEDANNEKLFFCREVYKKYQVGLKSLNALDFDDLILLTVKLFKDNKDVLDKCGNLYQFIMVDEFQDTNFAQYELIRLLAGNKPNLCVVGDDDQSIYSWRGADVTNILNFERDFKGSEVVHLEQNYRSTKTILEAANSVIERNQFRKEKKLWSNLGKGYSLDCVFAKDETDEAEFVAKKIKRIGEKFNIPRKDFCVLYRSNAQSRSFEVAFRQLKIPYVVIGGQNFFDRKEVKDIVSYLNLMKNPTDELSFLRIINCPRRGIGENTIIKLIDISHCEDISLYQLIKQHARELPVKKTAIGKLLKFQHFIEKYQIRFHDKRNKMGDVMKNMIEEMGYFNELKLTYKTDELIQNRWENVEELINSLGKSQEEDEFFSLDDFIDSISLQNDFGKEGDDALNSNAVRLMTLHGSKGMEFPFVFMVGMEEGLFPHKKTMSAESIEEERRLCYVGITRAKQHLVFVLTKQRYKNGRYIQCKPSRFLKEIPSHLLNRRLYHEVI